MPKVRPACTAPTWAAPTWAAPTWALTEPASASGLTVLCSTKLATAGSIPNWTAKFCNCASEKTTVPSLDWVGRDRADATGVFGISTTGCNCVIKLRSSIWDCCCGDKVAKTCCEDCACCSIDMELVGKLLPLGRSLPPSTEGVTSPDWPLKTCPNKPAVLGLTAELVLAPAVLVAFSKFSKSIWAIIISLH